MAVIPQGMTLRGASRSMRLAAIGMETSAAATR